MHECAWCECGVGCGGWLILGACMRHNWRPEVPGVAVDVPSCVAVASIALR